MEYDITITTNTFFKFDGAYEIIQEALDGQLTPFNVQFAFKTIMFSVNTRHYMEEIESIIYDCFDSEDIDQVRVVES